MSQVKLFLESLKPDELIRVTTFVRKIGKEKAVYDFIVSKLKKEFVLDEKNLAKIGVNESHFNKISSVLLTKAYQCLFPNAGLDLLLFLKDKNLPNHFKHAIWQHEKELLSKPKTEALNQYYLKTFHLLIDLPFTTYDEKLTAYIGERYLDTLIQRTPAWEQYVECHILFSDINRLSAKKNKKVRDRITLELLTTKELELESTDYYLARFYNYRSICSYYLYLEPTPPMAQAYLVKAIALEKHIAWFYPINISKFLNLMYADMLFFNNQFSQSYEIYSNVFADPLETNMYGYYYHCEQYVLVNLIREDFDTAEKALALNFEDAINKRLDIYATRGAMSYAKLYLSRGQLKEAIFYINLCREMNETATYHPFEFQIKILECIYFFLKGDFDFAERLCARNIKTIITNPESKRHTNYLTFYKLCLGFAKAKFNNTPISEKKIADFLTLERVLQNLYVNLPRKMLDRILEK